SGLGSLMPGGRMDVDVNDPGVQNAVNFAVVQHNRGTNDMYLHQAAEVVKAQRQVVAGMKYIITVKMAKTNCRKDRPNEVCAIHENPENPYQCEFTVWSRPWENFLQLVETKC
uniref:Cystatin-C-like n=1 Tax=Sphaeramia orbicularis TaxID=375764 RepID=A0A673BQN0_9TELE